MHKNDMHAFLCTRRDQSLWGMLSRAKESRSVYSSVWERARVRNEEFAAEA